MPFTFSIATGIGIAFIAHTVLKIITGRLSEVSLAVALVGALFIIKTVFA